MRNEARVYTISDLEIRISKIGIQHPRPSLEVLPAAENIAKISLASRKSLATSLRSPI
jgi:hypothetical protein